jgi:hypothetical protein
MIGSKGFTQERPARSQIALSVVLWLVAVVLAALSPFALRDVLMWGMALVIPQPDQFTRLRTAQTINVASQCGIVIFGIIAVVVMVFCTEYFFHNMGQPRFARRLGRIIAVECLIVIPVALFFWRA